MQNLLSHDIASEDFKDLTRRTLPDKALCDKDISKYLNHDVYQRGMV